MALANFVQGARAMKLCRFEGNKLGLVEEGEIADVSEALNALPAVRWPLPPGDLLIAHLDQVLDSVKSLREGAARFSTESIAFNSPVANPTKIIAAPVNYQKHIDEARADFEINRGTDVKAIDHYGLFLKANSSLVGPGEGVARRFPDRRIDHEAEIVVVIGKQGTNIPRARAFDHIAGYTMGLDMSIRGTEDRSLRKSVDSFSVVGPWLVTKDEIANPDNLDFELRVNGEMRQSSNTKYLIFDIAKQIEYASSFYTLYPGDILLTGTPEGVGPVAPGDVITMSADGLGEMRVEVHAA